jgi:hypothetical protein
MLRCPKHSTLLVNEIGIPPRLPALKNALTNGTDFLEFISK